ncbi:MAG: lipoprotein [Gammaproteobacteria bacterium]
MKNIALLALGMILVGCGFKGPLYMPDEPQAQPPTEPSVPENPEERLNAEDDD